MFLTRKHLSRRTLLKGAGATIDETAENVIRFIESSDPKLFTRKVGYVRVK